MLLPFEFLFPRGFFAADILVVFPLTCFLKFWTDVNFWRIFDENVLERYSGDLLFKLCTCGLIIELWQVSRNGNISWIDCFFLGFDFWHWLLILLETVLCGSRTFAQDFVSSFFFSIKGLSSGIYLWNWSELHVGTWAEHLRGFLRGICFCDQGLCERILFG